MTNRKGGGPPGDWSEVVEGLEEPAKENESPRDQLTGRPDDQIELVDRPNAVGNESKYAYRPSAPAFNRSPPSERAPSGLSLPSVSAPAASPDRPPTRSVPLEDAVPRALFEEGPRSSAAARAPRGRGLSPALIAVVLLSLAGLGAAYVLTRPPPPPPTGMISIVSEPPGADVFIDGSPIGQQTPAQVFDVEVGRYLRVEVRKPGFGVEPPQRAVEVTAEGTATAYFVLAPVRSVRIDTQPAGAEIQVDGRPVPGRSPVVLPTVEVGKVIRVEASLEGYMSKTIDYEVVAAGEDPPPIELLEAVKLSVLTEPAGAEVTWGEIELGPTPLYDARVAKNQRTTLRVKKPGYRPSSRTLRLTRDRELRIVLKEQPLSALPLSRSQRSEARRIDRDLSRASRFEAATRDAMRKAERRLETILNDPRSLFDVRAKAEAAVDRARERLGEAEEARIEAQAAAERFRATIIAGEE